MIMNREQHPADATLPAWPTFLSVLVAIIALIAITWLLRQTYAVTMPIAAAIIITMLVHLLHDWLRQRLSARLRWSATPLTLVAILLALLVSVGAIAWAVSLLASKVPQYAEQLQQSWMQLASWAKARGVPLNELAAGSLRNRAMNWLTQGVYFFWSALAGLVLVLFFVLLMLLEVRRWQEKVNTALKDSWAAATLDTVATVSHQLRQYLFVRTMMGLATAVLEGLWLWLVGVDLALVWAMVFFFLNYIPTIGSAVAAIPPTLIALVTLGPGWALVAIAGIFVIEQVMGNFVDPRWVGHKLSISPLVVLIAILFWGWVWGIVGAILAVPMTAILIIAAAHVPSLRSIALLLSRTSSEDELVTHTHRT